MANAARGEVELLCEGRRLTLCLTLGALAEIEAAFGDDRERMKRLSAADVLTILRALLKGGGEWRAAREIEWARLDPRAAAEAIAAAFAAAQEAA